MRPANERQRYNVTSTLIGWEHTQHIPASFIICALCTCCQFYHQRSRFVTRFLFMLTTYSWFHKNLRVQISRGNHQLFILDLTRSSETWQHRAGFFLQLVPLFGVTCHVRNTLLGGWIMDLIREINSLKPWSSLVHVIACYIFDDKSLPKPVLFYSQLDHYH